MDFAHLRVEPSFKEIPIVDFQEKEEVSNGLSPLPRLEYSEMRPKVQGLRAQFEAKAKLSA